MAAESLVRADVTTSRVFITDCECALLVGYLHRNSLLSDQAWQENKKENELDEQLRPVIDTISETMLRSACGSSISEVRSSVMTEKTYNTIMDIEKLAKEGSESGHDPHDFLNIGSTKLKYLNANDRSTFQYQNIIVRRDYHPVLAVA